ncbi:hypothetical protein FAES_4253 [Fibrella aestuarina BUZ 2]|uniref:DUF4239 domain-containing protein n=1 Tax=Fibrella aestuarina BUZ 2 TaxID=1166018 RepID=I0KDQ0_9BACT|nr:DUF4239 domain-containing protein [Fibrella aestuarina]CCH02253.1 hypothetical protein FAES_4253 [Fibrella aestuarina BUZ 2]
MTDLTNDESDRLVEDWMMFMRWMYDVPTWLLAILIIGAFVSVALLGLFITHRRIHKSSLATVIDNGTVGWFFSGVSVLYGLTLGLITVATWGNYATATAIASNESAAIAVLYRDLMGYPEPLQGELRNRLKAYTRTIIDHSWPAQQQGAISLKETSRLDEFQDAFLNGESQAESRAMLHAEALRAFNQMIELRRQRLDSIKGNVPGVLWSVVLIGALATITFSFFFLITNFSLHATMTGILAGMIGLLIFLLVVLDHPYWGEVSVTPEAYESVYTTLMDRVRK